MHVSAKDIADVLGGAEALGRSIRDLNDLNAAVTAGLPVAVLGALEARLAIAGKTTASSLRAIVRLRTYGNRNALVHSEGERAERVARIFAMAARVFGSDLAAATFMLTPHDLLVGRSPLDCLSTDIGGRAVEQIVDSIAFGLPA